MPAERLVVAVFTLLVIGSLAGFFVIQRAKHTPTLVQETRLKSRQTPTAAGSRTIEQLSFHVAHSERVTVSIVNSDGDTVRTLVAAMPLLAYQPVSLSWDGLTSTGARAPQGTYRVRVYLHGQRREVFFPQAFELETPGHAPESPQLRYLRHHTALVAVAGVASLLVILALALVFYRWPKAFAVAAVFTLPFRLPVSTQGTTANLLIPLYLVIGGGALAYLLTVVRPGRSWRSAARAGHDAELVPADAPSAHARRDPERPRMAARSLGGPVRDPGELLERRQQGPREPRLLLRPVPDHVRPAAAAGVDATATTRLPRLGRLPGARRCRGSGSWSTRASSSS